jgi:ribosomal-protein-alanine N-acetyltransferase
VVHEVAVAETHRGVGVGKALMDTLHDQARAAGVERIQLEHYAANAAAGALYDRLGYETMRMIRVKDL